MRKNDIKKLINYYLKKDLDFSNDCYTEWQWNCNRYKPTKYDENGEIKKIQKLTYNEICKEVVDNVLDIMPTEILKGDEGTIKDFLLEGSSSRLYNIFMSHNKGEYYINKSDIFDKLSEKINNNWNIDIPFNDFVKKLYKAIDRTIKSYKIGGNLKIDDWDMWEQDLYNNALAELGIGD